MIAKALMIPTARTGAYLTILFKCCGELWSFCELFAEAAQGRLPLRDVAMSCVLWYDGFVKQSRCFESCNVLIEWSYNSSVWL